MRNIVTLDAFRLVFERQQLLHFHAGRSRHIVFMPDSVHLFFEVVFGVFRRHNDEFFLVAAFRNVNPHGFRKRLFKILRKDFRIVDRLGKHYLVGNLHPRNVILSDKRRKPFAVRFFRVGRGEVFAALHSSASDE